MAAFSRPAPRAVPQVMVSSTFTDLEKHRAALIAALNSHGFHPNVMEDDSARLVDVIDSSLEMVRNSAAYILLISQKYGQTPECPRRNPQHLSITELEFEEAVRLGRPTLLFVMGDDHDVKARHVEPDAEKKAKLVAFRERAKRISPDSLVQRVYAVFNSLEEFKEKIGPPLAELREHLHSPESAEDPEKSASRSGGRRPATIPLPPAFHAEPDYIGSHGFVGRVSQLQDLDDWAKAADPGNLLLFEAIGGNGKSMLTWEWVRNRSTLLRDDWAGRFWYSFYERGAVMADFCRRALVYMTGEALEELAKERTPELARRLLAELHARPWLLVLDGLERVLVAYHRIDAAEVPDEEANTPTDKVLRRDPCDTIRDEDGDLLRQLAGARPSKILVTSRLTPRVLINKAGQGIEGVKRFPLPGLRPADAEALLRSCGIEGDSAAIQGYLSENCDNHPLVIGVLAGLITNYLPRRGDFDAWAADAGPLGGARLNLAELDLIQRRNHILHAALAALPAKSQELLSTLALLSGSVDYETLAAFNPHLPAEPEEVAEPKKPEEQWWWRWDRMSEEEKSRVREEYEVAHGRRREYEQALAAWRASAEVRAAPGRLVETVKELEQRGLLLFDRTAQRYDLHPVVRGVAAGGLQGEERERLGQRVVDHFSSVTHGPWEQARTLEDLAPGLHVVRTLLKLGRWQEAAEAYRGDLSDALLFTLEDHSEVLALLRPFFPEGWSELPRELEPDPASYLSNSAAISLGGSGAEDSAAVLLGKKLQADLASGFFAWATVGLSNLAASFEARNQLARASRLTSLALQLAEALDDEEQLFSNLLNLFVGQAQAGAWTAADETWRRLDPMGRSWSRATYRQGDAEWLFARAQFWRGQLREEHLVTATALAEKDNSRTTLRTLHWLRSAWKLEQEEWEAAAVAFHEAVTMARERRLLDAASEAGLALAKLHLGRLGTPEEARQEVERLAGGREPSHRYLALLWRQLGDLAQAADQALAAYRRAWADGEPHVRRYELTEATELLRELNVPIPELPPYDPAQDEPFPWEADVRAAISRIEAEKAQREAEEAETEEESEA